MNQNLNEGGIIDKVSLHMTRKMKFYIKIWRDKKERIFLKKEKVFLDKKKERIKNRIKTKIKKKRMFFKIIKEKESTKNNY